MVERSARPIDQPPSLDPVEGEGAGSVGLLLSFSGRAPVLYDVIVGPAGTAIVWWGRAVLLVLELGWVVTFERYCLSYCLSLGSTDGSDVASSDWFISIQI
jgi:hypothetical protein